MDLRTPPHFYQCWCSEFHNVVGLWFPDLLPCRVEGRASAFRETVRSAGFPTYLWGPFWRAWLTHPKASIYPGGSFQEGDKEIEMHTQTDVDVLVAFFFWKESHVLMLMCRTASAVLKIWRGGEWSIRANAVNEDPVEAFLQKNG